MKLTAVIETDLGEEYPRSAADRGHRFLGGFFFQARRCWTGSHGLREAVTWSLEEPATTKGVAQERRPNPHRVIPAASPARSKSTMVRPLNLRRDYNAVVVLERLQSTQGAKGQANAREK